MIKRKSAVSNPTFISLARTLVSQTEMSAIASQLERRIADGTTKMEEDLRAELNAHEARLRASHDDAIAGEGTYRVN